MDLKKSSLMLSKEEKDMLLCKIYRFAESISFKTLICTNIVKKRDMLTVVANNASIYPMWFDLDKGMYYISKDVQFSSLNEMLVNYENLNKNYISDLCLNYEEDEYMIPSEGVFL